MKAVRAGDLNIVGVNRDDVVTFAVLFTFHVVFYCYAIGGGKIGESCRRLNTCGCTQPDIGSCQTRR